MPDHIICLLRNFYAGQEATGQERIGHRRMDWFKIGRGVDQCCILSPALLMRRVHHEKCWAG